METIKILKHYSQYNIGVLSDGGFAVFVGPPTTKEQVERIESGELETRIIGYESVLFEDDEEKAFPYKNWFDIQVPVFPDSLLGLPLRWEELEPEQKDKFKIAEKSKVMDRLFEEFLYQKNTTPEEYKTLEASEKINLQIEFGQPDSKIQSLLNYQDEG